MLSLYHRKRLILGTASFEKNYGINKDKNLKKKEIIKIFKLCKKNNIQFLDSANQYKENNLKKFSKSLKDFKIIYKVNLNLNKKTYKQLKNKIFFLLKSFLRKNKIKKVYCIMIHSEDSMLSNNSYNLYKIISLIKKEGLAEKIGISGYNLEKILKIFENFRFDVLQFPYNLFDQRLNHANVLNFFKKKKTEIHIRSIFLQGIFFINVKKLPSYFNRWKKLFQKLNKNLINNKLSILNLCLSHAFNLNYQKKKIIFGIQSIDNLNEIKNVKLNYNKKFIKKLKSNDKKLILPYLWNIKKK